MENVAGFPPFRELHFENGCPFIDTDRHEILGAAHSPVCDHASCSCSAARRYSPA
jgi:hypothetical protein